MATNSTPVGSYGTWSIIVEKTGGDGVTYSQVRVRGVMYNGGAYRAYNNASATALSVGGEQAWSGSSFFDMPAKASQTVIDVYFNIWHTAAKTVTFSATLGATGTVTFGTGGTTSVGLTLPANTTVPAAPTTPTTSSVTNTSFVADINDNATGGAAITSRQIGYSTTNNSTTATWAAADASGTATITGRTPATTYYLWGRVANSVGTSLVSAVGTVSTLDVPAAPTTPTTSSVTNTSFVADINDNGTGGSAITSRQIGYSLTTDPNTATWVAADASGTATLTGKTPSALYYLWGRVANAFGYGAVSARGSVQTHDVPAAPTLPIITNVTQVTADVTFTDGVTNGSAVTARRIGWDTNGSAVTPANIVASDGSTTVTALPPGTRIYVWASEQNAYGWGPWSSRAQFDTVAGAYVFVGGVAKKAVPYLRVSGVWKLVKPWVKTFGVWRACG